MIVKELIIRNYKTDPNSGANTTYITLRVPSDYTWVFIDPQTANANVEIGSKPPQPSEKSLRVPATGRWLQVIPGNTIKIYNGSGANVNVTWAKA